MGCEKYEREGKFAIIDAFTGGIGSAAQRERYVVKNIDDVKELSENIRAAGGVLMQSSYSILNSKNIKYMLRL
jgi:hypothetical protein